jgi:hypothetical protein
LEQAEQDVFSTREAAERLGVLLRKRGGELARRAESDRYQVLMVDDEPEFRRLFELHLGSWGLPIELQSVPSGCCN